MRVWIKRFLSLLMLLFLFYVFFQWKGIHFATNKTSNSAVSFEKGRVVEVFEEDIEKRYGSLLVGMQKLEVEFLEGPEKGEKIHITNELGAGHSIYVGPSDPVIILADRPEGVPPFYAIYNYDRTFPLATMLVFFMGILLFVGRQKGALSALGLAISMYIIMFFLLPQIYLGKNIVLMTILTGLITSLYLMILLHGFTKKALMNLISIGISLLLCTLMYFVFSDLLHISGYNLEESEGLFLIYRQTGMDIRGMLFASVAISALGAAQDVAVSINSSLQEIRNIHPEVSNRQLFWSGINIGKDIIGTMVDTLLFAFVGSALGTLLIFISYGVQTNQFIHSDFFTIELLVSLIGTCSVILMVPISAFVASIMTTVEEEKNIKDTSK